jgi:RNA polymerase sigma factor (sigma-70 family)
MPVSAPPDGKASADTIFPRLIRLSQGMAADLASSSVTTLAEQDSAIAAVFRREARRLRGFIRRRVADACDAEDIAQDVFSELIEATRLATPIENVGAWLSRVAANRITDRFRRKSTVALDAAAADDEAAGHDAYARFASAEAGPEARYASRVRMARLEAALAELPAAQREVFIAHELEGRSFKSLAAESGVGLSTLLSRKRYAVLHLRNRLQADHDDCSTTSRETT